MPNFVDPRDFQPDLDMGIRWMCRICDTIEDPSFYCSDHQFEPVAIVPDSAEQA